MRKLSAKLWGRKKESDDYAEKTPDYAQISENNKVVPLAFSNVYNTHH